MTTENSPRAKALINAALTSRDPVRLGIALHTFQDTFAHQGFSGWREKLNSCYPWYYLKSSLPNVGHAEMMAVPDVINYVWTDPRNGREIDNRQRAMRGAKETYSILWRFHHATSSPQGWPKIKQTLTPFFSLSSYDKRIDKICAWSLNPKIDFKKTNKKLKRAKADKAFVKAASQHLSDAMEQFKGLPWQA